MRMLELENWQITSPFAGRRFLNSLCGKMISEIFSTLMEDAKERYLSIRSSITEGLTMSIFFFPGNDFEFRLSATKILTTAYTWKFSENFTEQHGQNRAESDESKTGGTWSCKCKGHKN